MQHIRKELPKCTTLTHSTDTFVITFEKKQCNLFLGVHTLCPHAKKKRRNARCHRILRQKCFKVGRTGRSCRAIMATCLTSSQRLAIGVFRNKCGTCFVVQHCELFTLSSHSFYLVYNAVASSAGAQLDRGAKKRTYGTLQHDICNTGKS